MKNWNIGKVKMEEMIDTDPEVYVERAKKALDNKRYDTAIQETETALKYSGNKMKYHTLMVNVLFNMQEYRQCIEYIREYKLVEYFLSDDYGRGLSFHPRMGILYEQRVQFRDVSCIGEDYFFDIYMECWKQCGSKLKETDVVVVKTDGSGMVKTLQDAIDMDIQCNKIAVISNRKNDKVQGVIEEKNLIITILAPLFSDARVHIGINSGNVRIVNSSFFAHRDSVGIEVNGGNILLSHVNISVDSDKGKNGTGIGLYVKNQATVDVEGCVFTGFYAGILAECGEIKVRHSVFSVSYLENHTYIVAIGKKDRVLLEMTDCDMDRGFLLAGFNTDTQIHGGYYGRNSVWHGGVILEGTLFNDSQNNEVMNIYDAKISIIEAYNGGNIYLHGVNDISYLAADNGKILGENCGSRSGCTASLKLGVGKNTEIVCDCNYKVDEKKFELIKGKLRMGAFLKGIKWLSEN